MKIGSLIWWRFIISQKNWMGRHLGEWVCHACVTYYRQWVCGWWLAVVMCHYRRIYNFWPIRTNSIFVYRAYCNANIGHFLWYTFCIWQLFFWIANALLISSFMFKYIEPVSRFYNFLCKSKYVLLFLKKIRANASKLILKCLHV